MSCKICKGGHRTQDHESFEKLKMEKEFNLDDEISCEEFRELIQTIAENQNEMARKLTNVCLAVKELQNGK